MDGRPPPQSLDGASCSGPEAVIGVRGHTLAAHIAARRTRVDQEGYTHMFLGIRKSKTPFAVLAAGLVLAIMTALGGFSSAATAVSGGSDTATRGTVAKNVNGKMTSKLVGTASDGSKVTGSFTPLKFIDKGGKQQVKGVVDGVVTHADGSKETFTALRTLQVKKINGKSLSGLTSRSAPGMAACDILHLVLGPLDLDLLGLQVHLDKVVLDIVAATGAGNLLGNLLCAVTGLLDGGPLAGLLGQLNDLLGQILDALNLGI